MIINKNEFTLYGLDNYTLIIEDIIYELKVKDYEFDFKMILTEAIANAFYHGNKSDSKLPIYIRYNLENEVVTLEIEDCGSGIKDINKLKLLDPIDLLNEGNRGLFLINCYAEKVKYQDRVLIVEKILQKEGVAL